MVNTDDCWLWGLEISEKGYGKFYANGKYHLAHRAVYMDMVGNIPKGLELDHLCRVTRCVNPEHLEAVTHHENMARWMGLKKDHCRRGHEFTPDNTITWIVSTGTQHRTCRACKLASERKRRQLKKDAVNNQQSKGE